MSDDAVAEVSDATFETDVLESNRPVVVAFSADWCGPCRAVEPLLGELAASQDETTSVVVLDVDDNPQTPSYYGIKSLPTFLRFLDGEVVDRIVGAVPKPRLEQLFES